MNQVLPFQAFALRWLQPRAKVFLALEQGLGKTVISALDLTPPALVVCTASMKFKWQHELNKWRPELTTSVVRSAKKPFTPADVVITNYESMYWLQFDQVEGKRKRTVHHVDFGHLETLIVDESHYCKSYDAVRTAVVSRKIRTTEKVRLLSGTPVVSRPIELWPLLYAIGATKLGYMEFGKLYCKGWKTPWGNWDFSRSSNEAELVEILEPVMLRMTKENVMPELPPKTYSVVELDLPVDKREKRFDIDDIEKNPEPVAFEAMPDILHMNAHRKLPLAIQHIKDRLEVMDKIVVFAHHRDIVDELLSGLAEFNPVRVVGGDSAQARYNAEKTFQEDPKCRVFVGNLVAAGEGLTLTAANWVVFVESSWTPKGIHQPADRCHRIGQVNPVTAEILTIHQSIDARMLHSVLKKMDIIGLIIKETDMAQLDNVAIASKLRELAELFSSLSTTAGVKEPKQEQVEVSEEKPTPAPATTKVALTLDHIREGMAKMIDVGKRADALKIIADTGAKKVSEIPSGHYESVMREIHAALGDAPF
jgi:SWI/SNF-related matrix-associated actin-dependent regulator 1 of chromatin subfamily A